jgi:hypothetical protein
MPLDGDDHTTAGVIALVADRMVHRTSNHPFVPAFTS